MRHWFQDTIIAKSLMGCLMQMAQEEGKATACEVFWRPPSFPLGETHLCAGARVAGQEVQRSWPITLVANEGYPQVIREWRKALRRSRPARLKWRPPQARR
jgi:hypothetical protein